MLSYALNRILLMIPTLFGVAALTFFMLRIMPGDIVELKLKADGARVTQQVLNMSAPASASTSRCRCSS